MTDITINEQLDSIKNASNSSLKIIETFLNEFESGGPDDLIANIIAHSLSSICGGLYAEAISSVGEEISGHRIASIALRELRHVADHVEAAIDKCDKQIM